MGAGHTHQQEGWNLGGWGAPGAESRGGKPDAAGGQRAGRPPSPPRLAEGSLRADMQRLVISRRCRIDHPRTFRRPHTCQ